MAPRRILETVSRYRGTAMVVGLGSAIAFTLSAMYIMGMDSKEIEGRVSPYEKRMTSSDVSATVSVPKPGKNRFPS